MLYMRQREAHKKRTWEERNHMPFSLQVNRVTTGEWSHSSTSLPSFCLWLLYSKLQNGLAFKRRSGVFTSQKCQWLRQLRILSIGKLQVQAFPLKKSQSSVCLFIWDVYSVSSSKEYGNEHRVFECQIIVQTQVICFYLPVIGLFLRFMSIPMFRWQS